MIASTAVAKYTPPFLVSIAAVDWVLAGAIGFGFAAGWAARAAVQVSKRESTALIWRDLLVSFLISGGCLLIVLLGVQYANLDALGAAVLSFIMAMGGVKLLSAVHSEATEWLRRKFTPVDQIMGERRQEAQKQIAATKIATKKDQDG